jgi:HemK-like putative methylase
MTQEESWLLRDKYGGEKTEGFFADCRRLLAGEPLAYVIGHVPFLGAIIHLDSHPLIPRSETEYWVEQVLHEMHTRGTRPIRVLDLCAGSGCIGVAVLLDIKSASVDFAEIDTRHHPTIMKNLDENHIEKSRARVFGGNLLENISGSYDFILTNPPYIDKELGRVDASVTKHEPHEALFADAGGFACIEQIITEAPHYLTQNGVLYVEHEPEHVQNILSCADKVGQIAETHRDQYGVSRFTRLTRREAGKVQE